MKRNYCILLSKSYTVDSVIVYHMTNQAANQETYQLVVACEAAAFANFYLVTSSL